MSRYDNHAAGKSTCFNVT